MGRPRAQRGFTLAEVLVAIAVFAVISAIAMTLYQQLQKTFKQGENAASQQQNTRIAFDRLIADLRMAGFNYNPDGDMSRPDEQIEGMWEHAVTVRGDYDFETSDATTPESTLGGASALYDIVSTGNDEIVTYALAKPGLSGGTTAQFQSDVTAVPRDGTVETVSINNIYLDVNSPPYTLYRITVQPASTSADYQPIADDIKELTFTYYDGAGNVLTSFAGGMDVAADKAQRARISKIGVKVVGMTEDPDLAYFDPADPNPATTHFRKFELSSDVTPRNLGFVGIPDLDLDDPSTPTGLSACAGHCKGLWTTWNANPSSEGVVKYEVTYGSAITTQGNAQDVYATSVFLNNLTQGSSYVVAAAAVDSAGNMSDPRAYSTGTTVAEATNPNTPTGVAGTSIGAGSALANQIEVTWTAPTKNTNTLSCDNPGGAGTPLRDLKGYRLFRGATAGFDPNVPAQVQATWDPNTLVGTDSDPNLTDASVVNCRTYYYKALAEDECAVKSAAAAGSGSATSTVPPAVPQSVAALDMGLQTSVLTWAPVTQDTSAPPQTVLIDSYVVERAAVSQGSDPNAATYAVVYDGPVPSPGSPSYTDVNVPNIPNTEDYYYRIKAHDDCPNESGPSLPALLTSCNFGGTIQISMSPGGNPVTGSQTITLTVTGGFSTTQGQVLVRDQGSGAVVLNQTSVSYPYTFTWNTAASPTVPGRTYDVLAAVTNNTGCTETQTTTVIVGSTVSCCITAATPLISTTALGSVGGGVKNNEVSYDIINNCGADVIIERWAQDWTDLLSNSPQLTAWTFEGFPDVILSPPVNPISGSSPIARFDLRVSPFTPYDLASGDTANVGYVFTKAMAAKVAGSPVGNSITTVYDFTVPGFGGGRCTVTVLADPNTPGIVLCDPTVDPNCPGF